MGRSYYQTYPPGGQDPGVLEPAMQAFFDFLRLRLLNFAVAGLLTLAYLLYQYWELLFCPKPVEEIDDQDQDGRDAPSTRPRSRSRNRDDDYYSHSSRRHHRSRHSRRKDSPGVYKKDSTAYYS